MLRASGEDAFYEDSLSRELNKQDLDKYSLDQEPSVPQPAALPSMMNVPVPGMVIVPPPVPASVAFLETSAPMEVCSWVMCGVSFFCHRTYTLYDPAWK